MIQKSIKLLFFLNVIVVESASIGEPFDFFLENHTLILITMILIIIRLLKYKQHDWLNN